MEKLPQKYQKPIGVLIFIGSLLISFSVLLIPLDPQQLARLGYIGIFIVTLLGAMTLFIPGPTMIAAFVIGAVLNPWLVSVIAGAGSALGESTGYMAGYATRTFLMPQEERGQWYWRIAHWMTRWPFLTLFLVSAVPNFITDVAGLSAGRIQYPYPKFLFATFLGKTIRFGIGAFLGARFGGALFQH